MSVNISVDLRAKFGAVRNQGARPTCMAFAASDTNSFAQGLVQPFSAEYAHYSAARRRVPLNPHRGVPIGLMIDGVREDGQPPEEAWPYLTAVPTPISAWIPPPNCAPIFRYRMLPKSTDVVSIVAALNCGHAALFAARITEQFHLPAPDHIVQTVSGDRDTGNHAMVAVGLGIIQSGTVILIRNSWGDQWADKGHAWLTVDYLAGRLLGVAAPF